MVRDDAIKMLQLRFEDLMNYTADDPTAPIDPLTYLTPEGDNCLHIAALRGDEEAVRLLLDVGVDINAKGDMGNTPLHYALSQKHLEVASLLRERGAAQNITNEFGRKPGE